MSDHHVVFLPGFMCDGRLFAAQAAALRSAGCQSSVADLSGAADMRRMARQVLAVAPRRFALVGLSMGGIVAFEVMRQAPERVTHLGLLNTTARADRSGPMRSAQLARVARGEVEAVLSEELKPQYLAEANRSYENLTLIADMGRRLGGDTFVRQTIALMARPSSEASLGDIRCPTLVLGGAHDAVCPPSLHSEIAEAIHDARLLIVPRCGHLSSLEAPDDVNRALLSLLNTTGADRAPTPVLNIVRSR